jgi:four helix bundle protein
VKKSIIGEKSLAYAVKVVQLYQFLTEKTDRREYIMSKQMLRSGTSIGANEKEGLRGQSVPDFVSKMNIALKEASETEYWIELLTVSEYIPEEYAESMLADCREIIKILTSIIKTSRK